MPQQKTKCQHGIVGFCRDCDLTKEFAKLESGQYPETNFKTVQSKGPHKGGYSKTPRR
jgi:hypothetical protein